MGHVALTLDGRFLRMPGDRTRPTRLRLGGVTIDTDVVFERLDLDHGRIALRTADGRYLAARPDAGLSYAIYPEDELTPAAAFEEVLWPNGQVSLRSCHLTYVSALTSGQVTANRTHAGRPERFFLVTVPVPSVPAQRTGPVQSAQSSAPRATSASPSSSAWRSDRMISGTA